jgi:O-antigen/teichoic acid export membrane protein
MLTGPEEFSIYANGAKEVPFISIVTGSISVVIMAEMSQNIKNNDLKKALGLFHRAALVSSIFLFPIMVFLLVYADDFIEILYSSKYRQSVLPFRIYLFAIPVRIAYYGSAFIAFGKTNIILVRSVVDLLLTLILSYIFVSLLGAYGASIGMILSLLIWSVPFNLYSLSKYFKCLPSDILPFKILGKILFFSILSGLISGILLLLNLNSLISFSLGLILFGGSYLFLTYRNIPSVNEMINPYLKSSIIFFKK